jgi:uncharacterized membrane protein YoaK (UPF0700 family)
MAIYSHPLWALLAGCLLAFLGAGVNACFLFQFGTSVSHLTGDVSKVALEIAYNKAHLSISALELCSATIGFVLGAAIAGYSIHHPTVAITRPYGRTILTIAVCLLIAYWTFTTYTVISIGIAAVACGLQNALATHYRGVILRTTHVTGLLTDLGTHFGMFVRGHHIAPWKLWVPFLIVITFFSGAILGCIIFARIGPNTLIGYSVAYLIIGSGLFFLQLMHTE